MLRKRLPDDGVAESGKESAAEPCSARGEEDLHPGASAAITDPAANNRNASRYERADPRAASVRATSIEVSTDATMNEVVTHAKYCAPPISATVVGRSDAVTNVFMA